jgi:hypothetical protein
MRSELANVVLKGISVLPPERLAKVVTFVREGGKLNVWSVLYCPLGIAYGTWAYGLKDLGLRPGSVEGDEFSEAHGFGPRNNPWDRIDNRYQWEAEQSAIDYEAEVLNRMWNYAIKKMYGA